MKNSIRKGFSFGLTSGIITTLGLIVGLHSSTHSSFVILGGVLVIAVADALSDSLGMHVSEESENQHTTREIWESTLITFITKFFVALTFVVPILLLPLNTAILVSVAWGLSLITFFNFHMAVQQKAKPFRVVMEHLAIAIFVIFVTHFIGDLVATFV